LKFQIIGNSVKKSFGSKLFAFPLRVRSLVQFIKYQKLDIAIGQSSFYLPVAAKFLGIPSIYTNDNEHAMGNIPSFFFASKIFLPENISISKAVKQGAKIEKIIQYPGIKEGIYLWPKGIEIQKSRNGQKPSKIYIRPEPQTAQYYSGKLNFLDDLLLELKNQYDFIILVRDKNQFDHYTQAQFLNINVPSNTLDFNSVASDCLLFIGAGGSMTREMAIMGIPTISVYQGKLLDVDNFLIAQNLMLHEPNLTSEKLEGFLSKTKSMTYNDSLIQKGNKAYNLIKETLFEMNSDNLKSHYKNV
jgi:predicted glycosyltransferase